MQWTELKMRGLHPGRKTTTDRPFGLVCGGLSPLPSRCFAQCGATLAAIVYHTVRERGASRTAHPAGLRLWEDSLPTGDDGQRPLFNTASDEQIKG
ncbi:MAG: hypothetical protein L0G70_11075, partial [Rubrobacter sp.]|nr:hypothetical protein [Rubrobacter sp.]